MKEALVVLLFLSIAMEKSLVNFPFAFFCVIVLYFLYPKDFFIYVLILLTGFLLDALNARLLGITPFLFFAFFLGFELLQKIIPVAPRKGYALYSIVGLFLYSIFFGYTAPILFYISLFVLVVIALKSKNSKKSILINR